MTRKTGPLLLCLTFFGLAGLSESAFQPTGEARGYLVTSAKSGQDAALSQAAGEFRVVAANLLWSKVVDHYHHQFMAQGGDWSKNESLLPILKTIIALDPHFTQAYQLMGGTILPKTGRLMEGVHVLEQGIKNNPNDWETYRELAMLYAWTERKPALALPYAQAGLAQANDDFSRSLMGRLCRTLTDMTQQPNQTPLKADGRPLPPPVVGASLERSRPSTSG